VRNFGRELKKFESFGEDWSGYGEREREVFRVFLEGERVSLDGEEAIGRFS